MAEALQVFLHGLEALELLLLHAVGHAGGLDVDEGEARVADGGLDDGGHARKVRGGGLGHEPRAVGQHVQEGIHGFLEASVPGGAGGEALVRGG